MVKTVLFVTNHIRGLEEVNTICNKKNLKCGGTLFSPNTPICESYSYAISPVEAGFDYALSLFNKFDQVVFLTNHNNLPVALMQKELEVIYNNSYKYNLSILDKEKLNFFGCSHTYGTGHNSGDTTYPAILSNMIGLEYNNYALPGISNYDIEDRLNKYSIQNSKIIVQFTDMYRIRYMFDNELNQTAVHRANSLVQNPILLSEENLFFNFQKKVERIVNRLREGNNQFLLTFTHNIDSNYTIKCLEFLLNFKEFRSMQGVNVDTAEDGIHFGIISHKMWAERLYKRWIELYGKQ